MSNEKQNPTHHMPQGNPATRRDGTVPTNEKSILTAGETRVLLWCGNGKTSFEISRILGLSEHTVNHYIASAVRKLDATNRTHAIAKAIKMQIVDIEDIN
ncbi:MAG: helix-turn-helix transcriptional regulator [Pseudomonadota bacterium]